MTNPEITSPEITSPEITSPEITSPEITSPEITEQASVAAAVAGAVPDRVGVSDRKLSQRQIEVLDGLDTIVVGEGFSGVTMQQLASRLKCSRRTLYELAPSKDELVLFVIDRRMRRTGRLAAEALELFDDPAERLIEFVMAGGSRMRHTTLRYQEDIVGFPAARRLVSAHYRYATLIVEEIVADGIERGVFRPMRAALVAEIADAAFERFQDPAVLQVHGLDFEGAAREVVELLSAALGNARPSGAS